MSRIAVFITSKLKTTAPPNKPAPRKNTGSKSALSSNNDNKPAFRRNNNNDKDDRFDIGRNDIKYTKKWEKLSKLENLSKLRKSKSEKMSKSWNLAKWEKNLLKSRNLTNFDITEARPKVLTPDAKITFNYLRLAFIEASIFWYFDLKYYIRMKTDALGYAISRILN